MRRASIGILWVSVIAVSAWSHGVDWLTRHLRYGEPDFSGIEIEWAFGDPESGALVRLRSATGYHPLTTGFFLVRSDELFPLRPKREARSKDHFDLVLGDEDASAKGTKQSVTIACGDKETMIPPMPSERVRRLVQDLRDQKARIHDRPPTFVERVFRFTSNSNHVYLSSLRSTMAGEHRFFIGEPGTMEPHVITQFFMYWDGGTTLVTAEGAGRLDIPQTMFETEGLPPLPTWTPAGETNGMELIEVPVTDELRDVLGISGQVVPASKHPGFCATFFGTDSGQK